MNRSKIAIGFVLIGIGVFFLLDFGLGLTSLSNYFTELYSVPVLFVLSLFLIHNAEKQIRSSSISNGKVRLPLFWSAASIVILVGVLFIYLLTAIAGALGNTH